MTPARSPDNAVTVTHYRHAPRPRPAQTERTHLTVPGRVAWSLFCGVAFWVPVLAWLWGG